MACSVLKKTLPCMRFFNQIIVHLTGLLSLSVTWNSNFELTLSYVKMFDQRGMACKDTTTAWVKVYILCWVTSICISIHTYKQKLRTSNYVLSQHLKTVWRKDEIQMLICWMFFTAYFLLNAFLLNSSLLNAFLLNAFLQVSH